MACDTFPPHRGWPWSRWRWYAACVSVCERYFSGGIIDLVESPRSLPTHTSDRSRGQPVFRVDNPLQGWRLPCHRISRRSGAPCRPIDPATGASDGAPFDPRYPPAIVEAEGSRVNREALLRWQSTPAVHRIIAARDSLPPGLPGRGEQLAALMKRGSAIRAQHYVGRRGHGQPVRTFDRHRSEPAKGASGGAA